MKRTSELERMLEGYGLTTARILYHMPDHPHLLQTYVWQDYDLAPRFPVLMKFVEFWIDKLDGPLHSIAYTHNKLIAPNEWKRVDGEIMLH
ncbi:aspartate-semialdehyde dehydrogenase [Nitratireductor mangrovi]|uniref:Aspartate-semialdehyde dehydrogenase n=1 Tax=Nitratireductor mangrovi TaxID=2599600 RepID=A0A5B8KWN7_9HYPH|nr:aspartate-semialdehyde dehydrogenase [Nitratireductor mangrovi]QDY99927.1 aspartate-semialdehyde dehydrogenase [Nitratireductor mangrovi]